MAVDNVSASPPQVAGAIRQAANTTGTSFEYLLTTAQIESHLNPAAQATTSSAGGLYQFIEQTWLATVKSAGAAFGRGQ
jgi:soluble lytic murein transglycosylase-like protein